MTTELPGWLTNDGTEASMLRVMTRIAGRERRIRATAPKPDPGPRVSRWRAQPPASVHWTREAWEAVYPDLAASWWKPWPDAPMPPQFDLPEFLRRMGQGPDKPALGRYVRDQYRAALAAARESSEMFDASQAALVAGMQESDGSAWQRIQRMREHMAPGFLDPDEMRADLAAGLAANASHIDLTVFPATKEEA